jgi:hypothetical protein
MDPVEQKNVMYNYKKDGKVCTTPNIDIAVARRDADSVIQTESILSNGKVEYGTVALK